MLVLPEQVAGLMIMSVDVGGWSNSSSVTEPVSRTGLGGSIILSKYALLLSPKINLTVDTYPATRAGQSGKTASPTDASTTGTAQFSSPISAKSLNALREHDLRCQKYNHSHKTQECLALPSSAASLCLIEASAPAGMKISFC